MPTTADLANALIARLNTIPGLEIYDGEPPLTPPNRYVCVYDDPGLASATRYARSGGSQRLTWTATAICVGKTPEGLRAAVEAVRAALTDWPPTPDSSPLAEIAASPSLTDGPNDDRRISKTFIYRCTTARS